MKRSDGTKLTITWGTIDALQPSSIKSSMSVETSAMKPEAKLGDRSGRISEWKTN